MDTNWNQLIERYLENELSAEGKLAFEQELAENNQLKREYNLHLDIRKAIIRASQRKTIQQIGKKYHRQHWLKLGLFIAFLLLGTWSVFYYFNTKPASYKTMNAPDFKQMEKHLAFHSIVPEYFEYQGGEALFESKNGVLVSVTNGTFLHHNLPYQGPVLIQWQEAIHAADIVKAGLSTESNGKLLETQGMFSIAAFTPEGEKLEISNQKGIYVQVPVVSYKEGMQLYQAEKLKNGRINWIHPTELEKLPQPRQIGLLNFYPPAFEPKLDELHWKTGRKERDSLYRSFELWDHEVGPSMIDTVKPIVEQEKNLNNHTVFYFQSDSIASAFQPKGSRHIPPSKVLAIWNDRFNSSLFATVDFEKRMKVIHETCNESVFDVYANQPNKKMWELDEQVVKMGYPQFAVFANERVGSIQFSNAHTNNLRHYYNSGIAQLQLLTKQERAKVLRIENNWDLHVKRTRKLETIRANRRFSQNIKEEYQLNLRNVARQLGCSVGFQLHGGGTVVNIDKLVMDATIARKSTTIIDPVTGKKAFIGYRPFSVSVSNGKAFDRLYLYLFSTELNTYQRIDPQNYAFQYSLNEDMHYQLVFVGINEQSFAIKMIPSSAIATHQDCLLETVSQRVFELTLNGLENKRINRKLSIEKELEWLFVEKENFKVQRLRMENQLFRAKLAPTIFSCLRTGDETAPEAMINDTVIK